MIEEGTVIAVHGETAEVKVGRHTECSGCGACGSSKNAVALLYNEVNANIGDRVKFSMPEENIIAGAFIVFIFPLIFAGIGASVAFIFFPGFIPHLAALFFLFSLIFVKLYDKRKRYDLKHNAKILEII